MSNKTFYGSLSSNTPSGNNVGEGDIGIFTNYAYATKFNYYVRCPEMGYDMKPMYAISVNDTPPSPQNFELRTPLFSGLSLPEKLKVPTLDIVFVDDDDHSLETDFREWLDNCNPSKTFIEDMVKTFIYGKTNTSRISKIVKTYKVIPSQVQGISMEQSNGYKTFSVSFNVVSF